MSGIYSSWRPWNNKNSLSIIHSNWKPVSKFFPFSNRTKLTVAQQQFLNNSGEKSEILYLTLNQKEFTVWNVKKIRAWELRETNTGDTNQILQLSVTEFRINPHPQLHTFIQVDKLYVCNLQVVRSRNSKHEQPERFLTDMSEWWSRMKQLWDACFGRVYLQLTLNLHNIFCLNHWGLFQAIHKPRHWICGQLHSFLY